MHVLIVEDNPFNSYCLKKLLESSFEGIQIDSFIDSQSALDHLKENDTDCIILDGDLGKEANLSCHGPKLAEIIWKTYPNLAIVAWTDSKAMREDFQKTYKKHNKLFNEFNCWSKLVTKDRIQKSLGYLYQNKSNINKNYGLHSQQTVMTG